MEDRIVFTEESAASLIENRMNLALGLSDTKDADALPPASHEELEGMISFLTGSSREAAAETMRLLSDAALAVRRKTYGDRVFFRGLIEFTNYCKNGCYYCGIGRDQRDVHRYRLSDEEILSCCRLGEKLGYRSYVLQGGEDPYYTDERMCALIGLIRKEFPGAAITLSLGEKEHESYVKYFEAGANRYLLRHETADPAHYGKLHPAEMSLSHRMNCLYDLKSIGYQVGAGFMAGSPYQTPATLAEDFVFLQELKPEMVGIGPFIPSAGTRFETAPAGTLELTLMMLAITRLLLPKVLLPSTTALGTIDPTGREKGFAYGANVVMPNLSPVRVRADYKLYDNKICTGDDAEDCFVCLNNRIRKSGNEPDYSRGDHADFREAAGMPGCGIEDIPDDKRLCEKKENI